MEDTQNIQEQIRMIQDALGEISEYLGSTLRNPISVSKRCIDFGFSLEEKEKI